MSERFADFGADPVTTARRLLGQELVRMLDGRRLAGRIVEVEAYLGPRDRAAHTFGGRRTQRNASMWLGGGHAYVYFTYGLHHCLNVVCGRPGEGTAVLIRALEPTQGEEAMRRRRRSARRETDLCSGPAKLTEALAVDLALDGIDLRRDRRLWIERTRLRAVPRRRLGVTSRVGVAYAGDWAEAPLRFYVRDNAHVSRPSPAPTRRRSESP